MAVQKHSQIWVGTGVMPSNKKVHGPDDVNWTGSFAGVMAILPSDASTEEAPRSGDLKTAELLGERVTRIAEKLAVQVVR
ncbi:hypothetical protein [Pseudomonas sp. NPDC089734]|uniref:hypothetical protein n=1 Tax=Pseudomonas sp. NPDC089734 TaxID=3364469 RepID=UPI0037FC7461